MEAFLELLFGNNRTWVDADLVTWHITEITVLPLVIIVGLAGNLLVFYIYHFRWQSNEDTLFKRYLALIDIINVTLALPALLYLTIYNHTDNFNETCIFLSYVALWTATLSGDVLILIAVDRYLKLCLLRRTGLGEPLIKKLFALIILVTSGMYVPIRWIFGKDTVYMFSYNVRITYCYIRTESKLGSLVMPFFTLTSSTTAATMTLFVVLYFQIIRKLRELSGKNEKLKSGREDDTRGRSQREAMHKSSVVFIVITAVFFFSYVLYYSTVIVSVMDPLVEGSLGPSTKAIFDLAKFGPLINHVTNPFIYGYSSARFRNEVVKIITFKAFDRDFFKRRNGTGGGARGIEDA